MRIKMSLSIVCLSKETFDWTVYVCMFPPLHHLQYWEYCLLSEW